MLHWSNRGYYAACWRRECGIFTVIFWCNFIEKIMKIRRSLAAGERCGWLARTVVVGCTVRLSHRSRWWCGASFVACCGVDHAGRIALAAFQDQRTIRAASKTFSPMRAVKKGLCSHRRCCNAHYCPRCYLPFVTFMYLDLASPLTLISSSSLLQKQSGCCGNTSHATRRMPMHGRTP